MSTIADTSRIASPPAETPTVYSWQTPLVIIACGCVIAMLNFGPRSAFGQFLTPMSIDLHWNRDVVSFAAAIQNLLWGAAQPFAGALADKYGAIRVLSVGAVLYALGLFLMAYSTTPTMLDLSAGVLVGLGLAGSSFSLVIGAFGKLVPERWRLLAFGIGTAAGSFGQFLFSPLANGIIKAAGWQSTLMTFGLLLLLVLPLSFALATRGNPAKVAGVAQQSAKQAIREAFRHRSYVLLVLGFFTCGFQLGFMTLHLPAYLIDRGLTADDGAWTIAIIGAFNIVGAILAGWFSGRMPKRFILSFIYFARALAIVAFISLPMSTTSAVLFGAVTGLLWLSTVAPTNGLVMVMFGTRWLTMLSGAAFFSHQVGAFLGSWLGGEVFTRTGSYDAVWWFAVLFGVLSAVINLPIVEKPVARLAAQPA
jgi:MFS family permease